MYVPHLMLQHQRYFWVFDRNERNLHVGQDTTVTVYIGPDKGFNHFFPPCRLLVKRQACVYHLLVALPAKLRGGTLSSAAVPYSNRPLTGMGSQED